MSDHPMQGLYVPALTAVDRDSNPDVARWIEHCRWLLAEGAHGLCPFGTTSEANSFSIDERTDMLTQLVEAGVGPANLMPGTGCSALTDTVRLTRHALDLGCGGVLMLPPFYYKAVTDEGLFRSFAEVIERVGDDRLRIYLYHIPPVAQVGFSLNLIERLITAYPKTVVGLKDSSGDWNNLKAILNAFPGFGAFTGSEKLLLDSLRLGGAGSINAVANVIPGPVARLCDTWQGDDAEAQQAKITAFRETFADYAPVPALKQIVAYLRNDPEWGHVRPPFLPLGEAEAAKIVAKIEQYGLMKTPA
ncbi:MAG: dihydrodipicolinate synthase family protein [Litorilinea sp.]